jgi:hypothetical protein
MSGPKHPWKKLEREYLSDKLHTLKDVADASGISYALVRKRSKTHGWGKRKKKIDKQADDQIEKEIVQEIVSEERKVREQLDRIANLMINQGYQRFIDPETGLVITRGITNAQTAISSMGKGADIKMKLHGIGKGEGDGDGNKSTQIFNFGQSQINDIDFRGIPDAELEQVHRELARRFGIKSVRQDKPADSSKKKRKR